MIAVIDFGSQYTHLLYQAICKLGYEAKLYKSYTEWELSSAYSSALVLSGGPRSVYEDETDYTVLKQYLEAEKPVLGICYGMQLIAHLMGGTVEKGEKGEYGNTKVRICDTTLWSTVWMSHRDHVTKLPTNSEVTMITENGLTAGFSMGELNENHDRPIHALQFHPEVKHTENGLSTLGNILEIMTGTEPQYQNMYWLNGVPKDINKAVVAFSGGVDSLVAATYVHKELGGNRVKCIYIDTGMMRIQDEEHIKKLKETIGLNIVTINAKDRFLDALRGIVAPELKRKNIGRVFIEVLEEEFGKLGQEYNYLVQGTIASDIQESSGGNGGQDVIKSHHNVGGLPEKMNLKIYEPLKDFYKSDVREFGHYNLHIKQEFLQRHPFPGPGLGIRILGDITEDKLRIARHSDQILYEELTLSYDGIVHYNSTWQAFTYVTNSMAVGVKGDSRSYGSVVGIRAVDSSDGMTATWTRFPYEILDRLSTRIMNEVDGVTRVVYDLSNKPSGTIEME